MAATASDIRRWLAGAKEEGATHLIVVCDTYDHEDYPVSVMPDTCPREIEAKYNGKEMQRVMEVYSMNHDIEEQMQERRAFHYD